MDRNGVCRIMKIGIHLSSYTRDWSDDGLGFVRHAAETGYQAVELPLMFPDCYDVGKAKDCSGNIIWIVPAEQG